MIRKNVKPIIIAILWSLAVLLLVVQYFQVQKIRFLEGKFEHLITLKVEMSKNRHTAEEVLARSSRLYFPAEEPALGWLKLQEELLSAAASYNIKKVTIDVPSTFSGGDSVFNLFPVNLTFFANYQDVLKWVTYVDTEFPSIDILKVSIHKEDSTLKGYSGAYAMTLRCRFKKIIRTSENHVSRSRKEGKI